MNNLLDFVSRLERHIQECRPCEGCGVSGTWDAGVCPSCRNDAREAGDEISKEHLLDRRRQDPAGTLVKAGVPPVLANTGFEEPKIWPEDPRFPQTSLCDWKGTPWSILLSGSIGAGKSMLAREVLLRQMYEGASGRFIRARRVPETYFTRDGCWADLESVDIVVVDDLGRGHPGNAWQALGELLNARYERHLATVVTTNLKLGQIANFDAAAADRLSVGMVVALTGESRRKVKS